MVSFGSQSVLEVNDRMAEVGRGLVQSSLGLLAVMQPRALAATLAVRTSLVTTRSQGFPFGKSQGFPHCLWLDLTLEHTQSTESKNSPYILEQRRGKVQEINNSEPLGTDTACRHLRVGAS